MRCPNASWSSSASWWPIFRCSRASRAASARSRTPASPISRRRTASNVILDAVAAALSPALRETAFALAVEVAAIDGRAKQNELAFLQMLEDRLTLPKITAGAIELSARARYRKLS